MKLNGSAIKTAILIFLIVSPALADNYIFDSDVQIISSDESGITFTYKAPDVALESFYGYPEKNKVPSIPHTTQSRIPGKPLLPVKIIPVGAPYSSRPTIKILSQNYTRIAEIDVPNFINELSEEQYLTKAANQKPYKNWPLQIASINKQEVIRGLRVIKVNLAAVKIENGVLYKAQSITVRVDFNNGAPLIQHPPRPISKVYDKILSSVVSNYNIAKNWRFYWPPKPLQSFVAQSPFDSSEVWVKLEAITSGIYKISRFQLSAAGLDMSEVNPQELRIFYGGGVELPIDNEEPRPQLREIPIYVYGSDDGIFNDSDYLLFYAESVDRYEYDDDNQEFEYILNHYTSKNVYWLTYSGNFEGSARRWTGINGSPSGSYSYAVDRFNDYVHQEKENVAKTNTDDYFEWFWGNNSAFSANISLINVVAGMNAIIKTKTNARFDTLKVNNSPATRISFSSNLSVYHSTNLNSGTSFNEISLFDNDNAFYLDYIDIIYNRWLIVSDNRLEFYSPDTAGVVEYRLSNVPSDYLLLDITYPDSVSKIVGAELSGDSLRFHNTHDAKRIFYLSSPTTYKNLNNISVYDSFTDDLRSTSNNADYIIITHEAFYEQSLELAAHRESSTPGLTAKVVKVEDVYNQFSWGLFDPLAIRDFLKYAFESWADPQPSYAILVGDGHYDYRNNIYSGGLMFIPPYEAPSGYGSDESYVYFGNFGYLDSDSNSVPDMIIGRLPANNTDQMEVMLNKIINYENNPTMGKWRNNIIITADDNLRPGTNNDMDHTHDSEDLAACVPSTFEILKIYLVEYPTRAGRRKPDARDDLIRAFNDGGLIVNWTGHGHKGMWAHEFFFRSVEDMPYLNNIDKLPLIISASCSVGLFDHPMEQGMSEDFLRYSNGGGIASIAATRPSGPGANNALNREVFNQLLVSGYISFGEAFYIAKCLRASNSNDRKYMLMGDPALIAGKPVLNTEFSYQPDSLTGLTVDSLAGYVCDDRGDIQTDFNGTVWILVKDASINRHKLLLDYNNNPALNSSGNLVGYYDYILPGPTIFNGPAQVVDGYFSTSFFVPKDVTYGGTSGKIYVYFEDGQIDGSGVTDTLAITGNFSAEEDSTGPTVEILYKNQSLSNGIVAVNTNPSFEVRLYDEHGINITGSMGHEISVKIDDGDLYSMDITDNFVFDMGDWQRGSAIFEIEDLPVGEYEISLKAWDNYNNSSLLTAIIQVYEDEQFAIKEVMNYPNPVRHADSTTFQYMLSNDAEEVSLKIFTLAGRKIKSFKLYDPEYTSSGYKYLAYNLRDDDNDKLASGVYIYKIEAVGKGIDNIQRRSEFQSKLVIFR